MTQSTTGKVTGLLLGSLAATGMFTALGSAPTAQASCISAFGIGNSVDCTECQRRRGKSFRRNRQ